jgi:peptide methionine sulfoxide reductase msrA/msrB
MLITKASYAIIAAGLSTIFILGLWGTSPLATLGGASWMQISEQRTSMNDQKTSSISESGYDITPLSEARIKELASDLTEEEARVILNQGTEPAFCGNLTDNKMDGTYICRLCDLPLFKSDSKFTSGTGWPSFFQPYDEAHVNTHRDTSYGMVRDEIVCARCNGHLGHVFNDGPKPTGLRFCVNSVSLDFVEISDKLPEQPMAKQVKTAYFAGGCFWGVEDRFAQLDGVLDSVSGYQGGDDTNPTYKEVCSGVTGHAESVMLRYDPSVISYEELLAFFFKIHNPTQGNRQGPDIGTQYRSAIYPTDENQMKLAKAFIEAEQREGKWSDRTITTELKMAPKFYKAEEYHQDYHLKHGGHCPLPD